MTDQRLRSVRPLDLDIIKRVDERNRHLALLALIADSTLPAMMGKTLADIAALLPATDDAVPLVNGGVAWKDASATERAPILARLGVLFAEHLPPEVAPPAPSTIDYVDAPAPVTIRLSYPFAVDGNVVREVSLRPPRYGDVAAVTAGRLGRTAMVAEMSGLPVEAIEALRWPDAERVIGAATDMAPDFAGG